MSGLLRDEWPASLHRNAYTYERFEASFWNRTTPGADGCVLWTGARGGNYGKVGVRGVMHFAHRVAYWMTKGELDPAMQIDHLCRIPLCVNPDHLEQVTPRENTLRSTGLPAINALKTHCVHGHEYTPENTKREPRGRACRTCRNQYMRRYRAARSKGAAA